MRTLTDTPKTDYMYSDNFHVNDCVLTVINDGNGSLCGMSYADRCAAAEFGLFEFRSACLKYSAYRRIHFHQRDLTRKEAFEAATILQAYYRNHARETAAVSK